MPDIALFLAASALLTVAPGPDIVYVLTRGVSQGPRAGVAAALDAWFHRRFERCAYIVRASLAICRGQLGQGPPVDNARATAEMFALTAQPI